MRLPSTVTLEHVAFAWMHVDDLDREPQARLPHERREQARKRIAAKVYARALTEAYRGQQEAWVAEMDALIDAMRREGRDLELGSMPSSQVATASTAYKRVQNVN